MIIREHLRLARKEYECMASDWIIECGLKNLPPLTFAEWRQIIRARDDNWRIPKGSNYLVQVIKGDDIFTFRARPEMHAICVKYELYPDE